jgi:naphtho-gamma-pyrone polyketide synthase
MAKPSSNGIVPQVMAIISKEAGIDLADLEPSSDFGDFGIDSLLSLTISIRVLEELGLNLPSTLFADFPTVQNLTDFLSRSDDTVASPFQEPSTSDSSSEACSDGEDTDSTSVTYGDNVIDIIRAAIAEETGIDVADLNSSTNFVDLGIDSLLALTVMGKLNEEMDMNLPSSLFADNDTLGEIENALGRKPKNSNVSMSPATPDTSLFRGDESQPRATSVMLQGNPKAASKKLFLFPDGSGSATSYAQIPSISPDIVVYGLNCPWMKTPKSMKCTVEALTSKYLAEIFRRQPTGPYYLGGWSAGGICAYEAAQQLALHNQETARLILIDSPNPVGLENPPQRMYDFFESLDFFGMNGKAPPTWLRPHFNAFISLLDHYQVKPFVGEHLQTHMVYARDGICKSPDDRRPEIRPDDPREMLWLLNNRTDFSGSGWLGLVGAKNLKIRVLDDVNHFSMVAVGPRIGELAAFMRRAME